MWPHYYSVLVSLKQMTNRLHPLLTAHFSTPIDDSTQLFDIDDSDVNLESGEADSTTDTDDSKDSEDAAI